MTSNASSDYALSISIICVPKSKITRLPLQLREPAYHSILKFNIYTLTFFFFFPPLHIALTAFILYFYESIEYHLMYATHFLFEHEDLHELSCL